MPINTKTADTIYTYAFNHYPRPLMSWLEPLDLAIKLYNDGDNQACIEQVDSMLTDTLPLYPRIRCRILLGHTLDDWVEAEVYRTSLTATTL